MSVSLRDFFAAHVAAAMVHRAESPAAIARRSYEIAQALLTERQYLEEIEHLEEREWVTDRSDGMRRPSDERARQKLSGSQVLDDWTEHLLDDPEPPPSERDDDWLPPATVPPPRQPVDDVPDEVLEELAELARHDQERRAELLEQAALEGVVAAWDPAWDDRSEMNDADRDAHWERALGDPPPPTRKSDRPGLARTQPDPQQMELAMPFPAGRKTGSS